MAFGKTYSSAPSRKQPKGTVFGIGRRVFVNWPRKGSIMLPATDRNGGPLDNDLADGQELEILSWQPRSSLGLIYEVRRLQDDTEWWISASHLRATGAPQQASIAVAD